MGECIIFFPKGHLQRLGVPLRSTLLSVCFTELPILLLFFIQEFPIFLTLQPA